MPEPIDDAAEIEFPEGIIGIPAARRFVLLEQQDSPVRLLQCVNIEGLGLPVVDPFLVDSDYRPNLGRHVLESLELARDEDVLLLAITRLCKDGPHVANLRAPLVVNVANRRALQVILDHGAYSLEVPIVPVGA